MGTPWGAGTYGRSKNPTRRLGAVAALGVPDVAGDADTSVAHTLVLKPGLVVHTIYNGYWFWGRPSFLDLWHDLREVSSASWRDWDLGAPGLREAWDAGDHAPFHGWNKRLSMPA
jgi:hypothetical protein